MHKMQTLQKVHKIIKTYTEHSSVSKPMNRTDVQRHQNKQRKRVQRKINNNNNNIIETPRKGEE